MEKFVEFLTSDLGNSGMKMWILLVAIIAVIIILGIVIGVLWSRKDKKKKANSVTETANDDFTTEPAITAPPSLQNVDDVAETEVKEEAIVTTTVKLDSQIEESVAETNDSDELVSAKPPVSGSKVDEAPKESSIVEESSPKVNAAPIAKEKSATVNEAKVSEKVIKEEPIAVKEVKASEKVVKEENTAKPITTVPVTTEKVEEKAKSEPTLVAEAASDKAPTAKPVAKKVVAKKIAPTAKVDAEAPKTNEPKKAKVVGTDALPKKIKNSIKLEEAKTVIETPANGESFGKYIIFKDERSNPNKPFKFALRANNGQLLFESEPYKVKPRETSIQAFKKHVQIGDFIVDEDKFGFFRYKLYTDAGKLLGVGESYKSRSSCESSIESVKRFSISATVIEDATLEEVTE